jgi:hypothetical protein
MPKLDVLFLQIFAMSSAVYLLQMSMQNNTARGSKGNYRDVLPEVHGQQMIPEDAFFICFQKLLPRGRMHHYEYDVNHGLDNRD